MPNYSNLSPQTLSGSTPSFSSQLSNKHLVLRGMFTACLLMLLSIAGLAALPQAAHADQGDVTTDDDLLNAANITVNDDIPYEVSFNAPQLTDDEIASLYDDTNTEIALEDEDTLLAGSGIRQFTPKASSRYQGKLPESALKLEWTSHNGNTANGIIRLNPSGWINRLSGEDFSRYNLIQLTVSQRLS